MNENNKNNTTVQDDNAKDTKILKATDRIELIDYTSLPDSYVNIDISLGSSDISFHTFLRLKEGDILTLDKQAGDGADIFVNNRVIGVGGIQVINSKFAIKIEDSINVNSIVNYLRDEQYLSDK